MITGWEQADLLNTMLNDTVRGYAERVASEWITVGKPDDGLLVTIGADGFLVRVEIADWLRRRCTATGLAEQVTAAIHKAECAAEQRRAELVRTDLDIDPRREP